MFDFRLVIGGAPHLGIRVHWGAMLKSIHLDILCDVIGTVYLGISWLHCLLKRSSTWSIPEFFGSSKA